MTKLPVFLRLKPKEGHKTEDKHFLRIAENCGNDSTRKVIVDPPKDSRYKAEEAFSFNGVFDEKTSQSEAYKEAVLPLVEYMANGTGDGLFFSMGASGSGKSHTVLGKQNCPGMVHFAFNTLFRAFNGSLADFDEIESYCDKFSPDRTSSAAEAGILMDWSPLTSFNGANKLTDAKLRAINEASKSLPSIQISNDFKYAVYLSMIEVYNDRIFDLLDDSKTSNVKTTKATHGRALPMKTDQATGKVSVSNLRKIYISDETEAFRTLEEGLGRRTVHSTGSNLTSSRSHAFISIQVKKIHRNPKKRTEISSTTLSMVDLAGSERVKVSKTNGHRYVESCAINKSLMLLGQCLQKQRDREEQGMHLTKSDASIFRNSKLTHLLLANAFNNSLSQKSVLMVNVDPYGDFSSASQILRYSALARQVSVPKTRIPSLKSIEIRTLSTSSTSSTDSGRVISSSSITSSASSISNNETEMRIPSGNKSQTLNSKMHQKIEYLERLVDDLRNQLDEANTRCSVIEEEIRQEMTDKMEIQTKQLQDSYKSIMELENERGQEFTDNKLELLAMMMHSPNSGDFNNQAIVSPEKSQWT